MNYFSEKRETILSYQKYREKKTEHLEVGKRLALILDEGSAVEQFTKMYTKDPLHFPGYEEKLRELQRRTGRTDALVCYTGTVEGIPVMACELGKNFLMGSMGTVVGEKIALAAEEAGKRKLPLIIFSASGGARMQEGMFSLMQMVKTSAAIKRYKQNGGFFISVLKNPTTGGVSASYASLGDVILAEPGALIGFAGPRVIEQTIGEKLPEGFQHAEFQLEHGFADRIVEKEEMKPVIALLLRLHGYGRKEKDIE